MVVVSFCLFFVCAILFFFSFNNDKEYVCVLGGIWEEMGRGKMWSKYNV